MYVTDLFLKFKKEQIQNCKKQDYDFIQQVLADTQLFDLTYYKDDVLEIEEDKPEVIKMLQKEFYLPFKYCFINTLSKEDIDTLKEDYDGLEIQTFIQLQEKSPDNIFGVAFCIFSLNGTVVQLTNRFNIIITEDDCTLHLDLVDLYLNMDKSKQLIEPYVQVLKKGLNSLLKIKTSINQQQDRNNLYLDNFLQQKQQSIQENAEFISKSLLDYSYCTLVYSLNKIQKIFNKLSSCDVLVDKYNKPEYFPRKKNSTIKVTNRPIYYVMQKDLSEQISRNIKSFSKLQPTHAFRVRGHWRRIDIQAIGKDRDGNYHIPGFTWVVDHIKGKGELVDKVRIIK